MDLAQGLNNLPGFPLYLSYARKYPEAILRKALTEARSIPAKKIKKSRGVSARNLMRAFYSAFEKAGISALRFHDLRHTFATGLVQAVVDIYAVQRLGRWKNISMVMLYAHHYPESLRPGVEVLDGVKKVSTNLAQCQLKGVNRFS